MALAKFGVTATKVHDAYFALLANFSTNSRPTDTAVGEFIDEEAADLAGKLKKKNVTASVIDAAQNTYPNAYAWCQKTLKLASAIRCFSAITATAPDVVKKWQKELDTRYEELDESGFAALGDAPAPAASATGPRSHIIEHDLDTGDASDMSDVIPTFRRNTQL